MTTTLIHIDEQIQRLKQKRDRVQTHQAVTFMRGAQKIFLNDFTPDLALSMLSDSWSTASPTQKKEWQKRGVCFRKVHSVPQPNRKKAKPPQSAAEETRDEEISHDDIS